MFSIPRHLDCSNEILEKYRTFNKKITNSTIFLSFYFNVFSIANLKVFNHRKKIKQVFLTQEYIFPIDTCLKYLTLDVCCIFK